MPRALRGDGDSRESDVGCRVHGTGSPGGEGKTTGVAHWESGAAEGDGGDDKW